MFIFTLKTNGCLKRLVKKTKKIPMLSKITPGGSYQKYLKPSKALALKLFGNL